MNFLKNNYEKLILAFLLTVFIILLALQLNLWQESSAIKVEAQRKWVDPTPNYERVFDNPQKPDHGFDILEKLGQRPGWGRSVTRDGQKVHTDLMQPYPMALCPHCVRVIPVSAFPPVNTAQVEKCPLCTRDLLAPQRPEQNVNLDTDGDGIPDQAERLLGLNPEDRTDGRVDSDNDGFSNYEEYIYKTKINDPKNRPAFHTQLQLISIDRPVLPFRLKNVTILDRKKPQSAVIQIEVNQASRRRRSKDISYRIGDIFGTLAGNFKIESLNPHFEKTAFGSEFKHAEITVVKQDNQEKIVMRVGAKVYESRDEIHVLRHASSGETEYNLYKNSEFRIGSMMTGEELYKVISIDRARNEITLQFNGRTVKVGKESAMNQAIRKAPKVVRPRKVKKKQ